MKKYFSMWAFMLACVFALTACSNDDDTDPYAPFTPTASSGAYVINQGNYYALLDGSIGYLDYGTKTFTDSIFRAQNSGMSPGSTLQSGVIYGDYFFSIAYASNIMFVSNKNTLKLVKSLNISAPRALITNGGYVFVSDYEGYVIRVDARNLVIKDSVKVGPNPEEMAIANGYLYVVNSDGLNYANSYQNGKSVSKINLSTFKVDKTISVGMNPTKIAADSKGNVFVIAIGNYANIPTKLQKIDANDNVTDSIGQVTSMYIDGTTLYAINSQTNWATYTTVNTYFKMNTETNVITDNLVSVGVKHPIAISVDPVTKYIYITSFNEGQYGADYSGAGYMNEYNASGTLLKTYKTGVNPVGLVFNVK